VAIFNDKLQPDIDGSVIWNCISNLIGRPIGQEEAMSPVIAASSHIENESKMTEHTDALKTLLLQLLLE
jgi:hypothetical protein